MISVCMATYNGSRYLKLQIESILCQLSDFDELIISDDNSTDDTVDIVNKYNDSRIKLILNKSPGGEIGKHVRVTSNFYNALKFAKGEYIFLSDQDDIWVMNRIGICISMLKHYDLVMCNCEIIDEYGISLRRSLWNNNPISKYFFINILKMPFHGCCIAFNSKVLNAAMPFPSKLISHDNWIGLLASKTGNIFFVEESLVYYRRHSGNVSLAKGRSDNTLFFKIYYRVILVVQIMTRFLRLK
jgi:glycosyltransferase involved in cell wall biosynthesis